MPLAPLSYFRPRRGLPPSRSLTSWTVGGISTPERVEPVDPQEPFDAPCDPADLACQTREAAKKVSAEKRRLEDLRRSRESSKANSVLGLLLFAYLGLRLLGIDPLSRMNG